MSDNLYSALVKIQAKLKNPGFDADNPHFRSKFVSLAGVRDAINAVATEHGVAVIQKVYTEGDQVGVQTHLIHQSGEMFEAGNVAMRPPKQNDPQSLGSVVTYLRRYSLMAAFNVVGDDDDDGNQASLDAVLTDIAEAGDLTELKYAYEVAMQRAKTAKDVNLQQRIAAAKDKRKAELANG